MATTHYVTAYKTIHMYYLKKSHDSLIDHVTKVHIDGLVNYHVVGCCKLATNQFVVDLFVIDLLQPTT